MNSWDWQAAFRWKFFDNRQGLPTTPTGQAGLETAGWKRLVAAANQDLRGPPRGDLEAGCQVQSLADLFAAGYAG